MGTTTALAAIELDRIQAQGIHPEADSALGKARSGVEDKVLRPLLGQPLGITRVGEVSVDKEVAQVQVDAGIVDKAGRLAW